MSTIAVTIPTDARLTFGGVVRSEFLKLTTMRGMWWVAATSVAISVLMPLTSSSEPPADDTASWTITTIGSGVIVPWVIVACFAALQTTSEWSSGQFRVTFATVPSRNLWLAAKATALGVYAAAVSLVVLVLSAVVVLLRHSGSGAAIDVGLAQTWQLLIGVPAVFFVTAVMSVGIGALVRSGGVAVTIVIVTLVILPFAGAFGLLGLDWISHIVSYLPSGAGDAIIGSGAFGPATDDLGIVLGSIVLLAWAAVACGAASIALKNRDA